MDFAEKIKKELNECKVTINNDTFRKELFEVLDMLVDKVIALDDVACCAPDVTEEVVEEIHKPKKGRK